MPILSGSCWVIVVIILLTIIWLACFATPGRFTRILWYCWDEFRRSFEFVFGIDPPDHYQPEDYLASLPPVPDVKLSPVTPADSSSSASEDTPPRLESTSAIIHQPPAPLPARVTRSRARPVVVTPVAQMSPIVEEPIERQPAAKPSKPKPRRRSKSATPKSGSSKSSTTTTPSRRSLRSTPSNSSRTTPSASASSTSVGTTPPPTRRSTRGRILKPTPVASANTSQLGEAAGTAVTPRRSTRKVSFATKVPASPVTPKREPDSDSSSPEARQVRTRRNRPK